MIKYFLVFFIFLFSYNAYSTVTTITLSRLSFSYLPDAQCTLNASTLKRHTDTCEAWGQSGGMDAIVTLSAGQTHSFSFTNEYHPCQNKTNTTVNFIAKNNFQRKARIITTHSLDVGHITDLAGIRSFALDDKKTDVTKAVSADFNCLTDIQTVNSPLDCVENFGFLSCGHSSIRVDKRLFDQECTVQNDITVCPSPPESKMVSKSSCEILASTPTSFEFCRVYRTSPLDSNTPVRTNIGQIPISFSVPYFIPPPTPPPPTPPPLTPPPLGTGIGDGTGTDMTGVISAINSLRASSNKGLTDIEHEIRDSQRDNTRELRKIEDAIDDASKDNRRDLGKVEDAIDDASRDNRADLGKIEDGIKGLGDLNADISIQGITFADSSSRLFTGFANAPLISSFSNLSLNNAIVGSSCPTAVLPFLGKDYTLDFHCFLLEQNRGLFEMLFIAIWSMLAVYIFLKA